MKYFFQILSVLLFATSLQAQKPVFQQIDYLPVKNESTSLKYPWGGGLNSAQFNEADLNNDGITDWVIYEKTEDRLLTMLSNAQGESKIERNYSSKFPIIQGWIVMKDITCDGIEDLFTFSNGSIIVYQGFYENDTLNFQLLSDGIFYSGFSGRINLYSSFVDRPAIADMDGDGDLDILTFNVTANRMLLYKNLQKERSLPCDTLVFKLEDNCWGNIYESGLSPKVDLRDTCSSKFPFPGRIDPSFAESFANQRRHSGSTVEAFDINGNGTMDALMGDVSFSFLNYLPNSGTPDIASVIDQDTSFPSYNIAARTYSFPLPVFIDVDKDGKKDLIVTPFEGFGVDNVSNVLLYNNVGTDSVQLAFNTRSFMVGDMIDVGENAVPCFIDIDGDGLTDLLVAGGVRLGGQPLQYKIAYFRNIGFADYPLFSLQQDDFLGFNSLGLNDPYPSAGDVDGDGKIDLLVGLGDGRILFYRNQSSSNGFSASTPVLLKIGSADLDVGQNAAPCIVDVNKDNRADLIVGERNGNVNYFRNMSGSGTNIQWQEVTDSVGKLNTSTPFIPFGNSAPLVKDFNKDGKLDLLLGGFDKILYWVNNIEDSLFSRVIPTDIFPSTYNKGRNATPAAADLTADGQWELILGTLAGGLNMYSQNPPEPRPVSVIPKQSANLLFNLYPNPNQGLFFLNINDIESKEPIYWQVIDVSGRVLETGMLMANNLKIQLQTLAEGMYFLVLSSTTKQGAKPFVIAK